MVQCRQPRGTDAEPRGRRYFSTQYPRLCRSYLQHDLKHACPFIRAASKNRVTCTRQFLFEI